MSELNDSMLIELVRKNSFIYDKRDSLFKNKEAKRNAWKSIGEELNKNAGECEQRWNVLRTRYNTERRELEKPSGSAGGYKGKRHLFDGLRFLDQHLIKKKTKGNIETVVKYSTEQNESDPSVLEALNVNIPEVDVEQNTTETELELFSPRSVQSSSTSMPATETESWSQISSTPSMSVMRKQNTKTKCRNSTTVADENINAAIQNMQSYFKQKKDNTDPENSDMCFAKQVYYHLRDIKNEKQKTSIKIKILKLFMDTMEDEAEEN